MKRILSTAGVALALTMFAAAPAEAQRAEGERGPRAERQQGAGAQQRFMMRGLFRGIELTEAQRGQIRAIHEGYRPRMQSLREAAQESMTTARAARQRGDTAAARAAMQPHRQAMLQLATAQRGEIRNVLTEEQRATFDRNVAERRARAEQGRQRGDGERRGQRGKRAPRG